MIISKYDNFLMTAQKQAIMAGTKQRSALANYIRPKQRLTTGRTQYAHTVKGIENKNTENSVTFVTFVTLHSLTCLLINLFTLKIK